MFWSYVFYYRFILKICASVTRIKQIKLMMLFRRARAELMGMCFESTRIQLRCEHVLYYALQAGSN